MNGVENQFFDRHSEAKRVKERCTLTCSRNPPRSHHNTSARFRSPLSPLNTPLGPPASFRSQVRLCAVEEPRDARYSFPTLAPRTPRRISLPLLLPASDAPYESAPIPTPSTFLPHMCTTPRNPLQVLAKDARVRRARGHAAPRNAWGRSRLRHNDEHLIARDLGGRRCSRSWQCSVHDLLNIS